MEIKERVQPFDHMPDTVIVGGERYVDPIEVKPNGWFETPYGVVELLRITGVKVEFSPLQRAYKLALPIQDGERFMYQTFRIGDTIEDWQDAIKQLFISRDNEPTIKNS